MTNNIRSVLCSGLFLASASGFSAEIPAGGESVLTKDLLQKLFNKDELL